MEQEQILLKGLNFIPSPKFSEIIRREWLETSRATRRIKIHNATFDENDKTNRSSNTNINENDNNTNKKPLPDKLKIQKTSAHRKLDSQSRICFLEN